MRASHLLIAGSLALPCAAQQPGDLDTTFASSGTLVLPDYGEVRDMAQQFDGSILVLTSPFNGLNQRMVIRLEEDGTIDTTYGLGGVSLAPPGAMRILQDNYGRTVLCGSGQLVRTDSQGDLDPTFGVGGSVQMNMIPYMVVNDADIYPDGRILLVGRTVSDGWTLRLMPNGNVDSTFASGGLLVRPNLGGSCYYYRTENHRCQVLADGRLLIEYQVWGHSMCSGPGTPSNDLITEFLLQDGVWISSMPSVTAYYMCPQPGAIRANTFGCMAAAYGICAGPGSEMRCWDLPGMTCTGPLSAQFLPYASGSRSIGSIRTDQQERFLVPLAESGQFRIYRTDLSSLSMDASWGQIGGGVTTTFGLGTGAGATCVLSQLDGKILAGGWVIVTYQKRLALARYHNIPDPRCVIAPRVLLGGAYDANDQLMRDDLRAAGLVPAAQPYTALGYSSPNATLFPPIQTGVLDAADSTAIVDWVWLELLSAADPSIVVAARPALVRRDGYVVKTDGHSAIDMNCGAGDYFLRVRHRNHLSATVSDTLHLGATSTAIDLTSPLTSIFGANAQMEVNGMRMLWPGDVNGDGLVRYMGAANDRDAVLLSIGGAIATATTTGYLRTDVNLDGVVKYMGADNDRDIILQTVGGSVPTAVRVEQGP